MARSISVSLIVLQSRSELLPATRFPESWFQLSSCKANAISLRLERSWKSGQDRLHGGAVAVIVKAGARRLGFAWAPAGLDNFTKGSSVTLLYCCYNESFIFS